MQTLRRMALPSPLSLTWKAVVEEGIQLGCDGQTAHGLVVGMESSPLRPDSTQLWCEPLTGEVGAEVFVMLLHRRKVL